MSLSMCDNTNGSDPFSYLPICSRAFGNGFVDAILIQTIDLKSRRESTVSLLGESILDLGRFTNGSTEIDYNRG